MNVSPGAASVRISNGTAKHVRRGESWATEGTAAVLAADCDGVLIESREDHPNNCTCASTTRITYPDGLAGGPGNRRVEISSKRACE